MEIYEDPTTDDFRKHLAEVSKSELSRVTIFKGSRRRSDGNDRELTIEIWDDGPDNPFRWMVTAEDDEGHHAEGNPGSDLETTMATVHWHDLDGDDVY